jgi:hypothetical protein
MVVGVAMEEKCKGDGDDDDGDVVVDGEEEDGAD